MAIESFIWRLIRGDGGKRYSRRRRRIIVYVVRMKHELLDSHFYSSSFYTPIEVTRRAGLELSSCINRRKNNHNRDIWVSETLDLSR